MHIYFLHHSSVCVNLGNSLLVFDYLLDDPDGRLGCTVIDKEHFADVDRVYVFVSHAHSDHFDPRIFDWSGGQVKYILDDTVPIQGAPEGAVFLHRGCEYQDSHIYVREFGSTDIGGSFFVMCEQTSFFHAGDLNDWHWKDDGNVRYSRVMSRLYQRELRFLARHVRSIDYAFFPVDKRMGTDFDSGADLFIKKMRPRFLIPIHFVAFEDTLAYSKKMRCSGTKVLPVHHKKERLV